MPTPHRILDASANRAAEGLRVVEDYARFVLDDAHLTAQVKSLRHDLAACLALLPMADRLAARDTTDDVGTEITTAAEASRADAWQVCTASSERVKQSLRSLEEYGKLHSAEFAARIEQLRYRHYTLERAIGITTTAIDRLHFCSLCVLVDGRDSLDAFAELCTQVVAAGVPMIQLRDKRLDDRALLERARLLVEIAASDAHAEGHANTHTLTIVNDRPDIAAAAGADGVHLGQDDLPPKAARDILGPRALIGVSTHNIHQARAAVLDGASYIGAGPTFPSETKSFDAFPGLDYLREVAAEVRLPTLAIGGITAENLPEVLATGVGGVAVSSAVAAAPDPGAAAREMLHVLSRPR